MVLVNFIQMGPSGLAYRMEKNPIMAGGMAHSSIQRKRRAHFMRTMVLKYFLKWLLGWAFVFLLFAEPGILFAGNSGCGDCGKAPKQGPPGPAGPTGPAGPPGSLSSDFGFAFILNSVSGTTVNDGDFVPFTMANFTNTPPGTNLSIINGGTGSAGVEIADTGFYQITYGVSVGSPNTIWQIKLGGGGGPSLGQQTLQTAGLSAQLCTATCIIEITANPTTVGLQNITGANALLQNNLNTVSAIVAFMTLVKLL